MVLNPGSSSALAINPMLEAKQIADLMRTARASVLVTLAPALNPKGWSGLAAELASLPDLKAIAFVDMADYLDGGMREAARASIEEAAARSPVKVVNLCEAMREQPSDHLLADRPIRPNDISSYICTGGTTGAPKIAVRTHRNEVFELLGRFESHGDGIVRVNSILPARAPGRVGAPMFLLTNCRRAWPASTPKIAYTYLP